MPFCTDPRDPTESADGGQRWSCLGKADVLLEHLQPDLVSKWGTGFPNRRSTLVISSSFFHLLAFILKMLAHMYFGVCGVREHVACFRPTALLFSASTNCREEIRKAHTRNEAVNNVVSKVIRLAVFGYNTTAGLTVDRS